MKNPINDIIALQNYILYCGIGVDIEVTNNTIHADIIASSNLSTIWINRINGSQSARELSYVKALLLNNELTAFLIGLYLFSDASRLKMKKPFRHNNIMILSLSKYFYIYQHRSTNIRSMLCIT